MAIPKFGNNIAAMISKLQDDAMAYARKGDLKKAVATAQKAYNIAPQNIKTLEILNAALIRLFDFDKAIEFGLKTIKLNPNNLNACDTLAHAYGYKGDWQKCGEFGKRALEIRDAMVMTSLGGKLPALPQVKDESNRTKNIISFTLFGSSPYYCETAILNAQLVREIYPENWICRFYIDESVPETIVKRLKEQGSEIVIADDEMKKFPKILWRFLAADDENAKFVVFRDADSVISEREAWCVNEWQQSDKLFHIIRDGSSHTELILAGTWGMRAGLFNMKDLMTDYFKYAKIDGRYDDQFFLRGKIWPYARQSVLMHDRIFGFMDAKKIAPHLFFDYAITHIGCCEGNATINVNAPTGVKDASRVKWQLFSRISPKLDKNLNIVDSGNERFICEYEAVVKNAKIEIFLPRRYAYGFSNGLSRINIDVL